MVKKIKGILSVFMTIVFVSAFCIVPGAETSEAADSAASKEWQYIYFGSYPQSEVTDEETIAAIKAAANEVSQQGVDEFNKLWGDRGYDITVNGVLYRCITYSDIEVESEETRWGGARYFKWEPIKWRVLKNDGDSLFVMACRGLDIATYQKTGAVFPTSLTWEECALKKWMNTSFLRRAFTNEEQKAVRTTTITNEANALYGTSGGNDTQDKVFALSYNEVTNPEFGFREDNAVSTSSRWVMPSDYASSLGLSSRSDTLFTGGNKTCNWWLRSPGKYPYYKQYVDCEGEIDPSGFFSDSQYAAVPAMYIDVSSDLWTEADGEGEVKRLEKTPMPVSSIPSGSEVVAYSRFELSCPVESENVVIYWLMDQRPFKQDYERYKNGPYDVVWKSGKLYATAIAEGYEESDLAVFEYTTREAEKPGEQWGSGSTETGSSNTPGTNTETGSNASGTNTGASGSSQSGSGSGESNNGSNTTDTSENPQSTTESLSKGSVITDTKSESVYKVTAAEGSKLTVEYVKPSDSTVSTISIPESVILNGATYEVTTVSPKAFKDCKKLKSVTIGRNVTAIGNQAFYNCKKLTKVTIPAKVNKIGKSAFQGCKKLKNITIKTTKLTNKNVGSNAFKGIHAKAAIKVPKSKVTAYKKLLKKKGAGSKVSIK